RGQRVCLAVHDAERRLRNEDAVPERQRMLQAAAEERLVDLFVVEGQQAHGERGVTIEEPAPAPLAPERAYVDDSAVLNLPVDPRNLTRENPEVPGVGALLSSGVQEDGSHDGRERGNGETRRGFKSYDSLAFPCSGVPQFPVVRIASSVRVLLSSRRLPRQAPLRRRKSGSRRRSRRTRV